MVRYELLFQYGGVYLDTDVECRKNIEPLLAGVPAFAAIEQWGVIGTAIVGGAMGHPLFLEIMRGVPESFRRYEGDPVASMGPKYLTHCLFDYLDRNPGEVYVFDKCFFYPYGHWETHRRDEPFPWAFAAHHWLGSWYR